MYVLCETAVDSEPLFSDSSTVFYFVPNDVGFYLHIESKTEI